MLGGFSLERQNCSTCSFKTPLCYDACKKPQPILLLTMLSCFWEHPNLSSSLPRHRKHPHQAYTLCFCSDVYVFQDAGIWLKTVSGVYSNTLAGREGSCDPASAGVLSAAALHLTKLFSFCTSYLLFYRSLSEQSLPSSSCEPYACYCFSSSCQAFPSFLTLTFSVLIRQLVMVMFCQWAGWPRGICREMLEPTLNMYLLFLLVFCCLFFHFS